MRTIDQLKVKNDRLTEEVQQKQRLLQLSEERIDNISTDNEKEEALIRENHKLSEMIKELQITAESKVKTIENLENEVNRLEQAVELQNETSSLDYEREKKITRLEIDLEGQQRLCNIQETRCDQLQKL